MGGGPWGFSIHPCPGATTKSSPAQNLFGVWAQGGMEGGVVNVAGYSTHAHLGKTMRMKKKGEMAREETNLTPLGSNLLLHQLGVREVVRVPREVALPIGVLDVQPDDVIGDVVGVKPIVHRQRVLPGRPHRLNPIPNTLQILCWGRGQQTAPIQIKNQNDLTARQRTLPTGEVGSGHNPPPPHSCSCATFM